MPEHRMNCRRNGVRPKPEQAGAAEPAGARAVSVEEMQVPAADQLPQPAGFGVEASTSNSGSTLLAEYEVPANALGRLREASLSLESNGAGTVSVSGVQYGSFSGPVDITLPLEPAVLTPGSKVRVLFNSTDGSSTTGQSTLTVGEVS
jgi:hypothetical protein